MEKRANYVAPTTELTHMDVESMITVSVTNERQYENPNDRSGTNKVEEKNLGNGDPIKGQNIEGTGNRAKGGPWDDYSWDSWD